MEENQMKESMERRKGSLNGLRKYIRQINERLNNGENVWSGENPISTVSENQ